MGGIIQGRERKRCGGCHWIGNLAFRFVYVMGNMLVEVREGLLLLGYLFYFVNFVAIN